MKDQTPSKRYKIGDLVPTSGAYLCVPCGYVQEFEEGTRFITCEACFAGTPDGPEESQDPNDEFWEFLP